MPTPATRSPLITPQDEWLFSEGTHGRLYDKLGAHLVAVDGTPGVHFAVWAPNARGVSVMGDFDDWNGNRHPLRAHGDCGLWSTFIPGVAEGELYKYVIDSPHKPDKLHKADPFAFAAEMRPGTASCVADLSQHTWGDADWLEARAERDPLRTPVSIYELHLGSWMRTPKGEWLSYRDAAARLRDYVVEMGFTHVELMPITEHPFDGSWGYQTTGYFAPTRRFGHPTDFMFFVDTLHQAGIGVILDWAPAHFPNDAHALALFDGTHLYEHADKRQGHHPDWDTIIFNLGRVEVSNFLLASASFWLDRYHIDGLRVDAVASMLYLDYSRQEGEWIPNRHGGRENLESIAFLKRMNEQVYGDFPGVMTIAEESTAWPGVSRPTYDGGLGFGFKWDMGWMHDTLSYMGKEPVHRAHHHEQLTFRGLYMFTEHFVLPLSHDEVVHGKGSLLGRMPGDDWQRFANLRLLLANMYAQPGKKLLFMGGEFGQWDEWNHDRSLDWHLLEHAPHLGVQEFVRELNMLYRNEPALHDTDCEPDAFQWVDCDDRTQSVLSWSRKSPESSETLLFILNCTPVPRPGYRVGVSVGGAWKTVINSDETRFGGSGWQVAPSIRTSKKAWHGRPHSVQIDLPPLAVVALKKSAPGRRRT